ncbi:MAG: hypothetical protein BGO96_02240 [Micrococcales bacterium 73-15]|uniref:ABC1 kinase family protein n=1 Tax=Salana multivorans TaxID=120377 RepID=UPI0009623893|nr:AarF/ABC1/UbiB kinase family protein [Salana multivorans]OJX96916.1 MAG: hypothetical protein BGO96_02240 [Micrococcales bacterium 73-15]
MNPLTWVLALVTALAVASLARFVARRLLGAPVGWARGLVVGLVFYLLLSPMLTRAASAAALVDAATLELTASPEVAVAVILLVLVWAFLLGVALLLLAEMLAPTGSVRDPITWVRDAIAARRRTRRYVQVGVIVTRHGLRRLLRGDPRGADGTRIGRALVEVLQDSGVTFVKFGQVASTRGDLLPPALVTELATLQSSVAPEPWDRIAAVLDAELPGWRDRLRVEEEPLAAASIAQVHRARLVTDEVDDDGRPVELRVVVKVQRPDAREQVSVDVDILQRLARTLTSRAAWARDMDVEGLVAGFSTALVEELDYRREAENMRLVAAATASSDVRVPVVHDAESTTRVVVMEEVEGVTLDRGAAFLATLPAQRRAELARTLMASVLHQILVTGVFHADLHPGNVVVTPDARLVLLDLGSVGVLDRELRELILGLLAAFDAEDNETAVTLLLRLLPPGEYDAYALRRDLGAAMTVIAGGAGVGSAGLALLFDVFRTHRLALPPHVAGALRTVGSLQGCLAILDPGADLADLVRSGTRQVAKDLVDLDEVRGLAVSRGIALGSLATSAPGVIDAGVRSLALGRPTRSVVGGLAGIARAAMAELVPTIVAGILVLAAVMLFAVPGGPMLTQTISWATYLAAFVGAAGTALVLRVLFRQAATT